MRKSYDFTGAQKNPYAKRLEKQVTIRLDQETITRARRLHPSNARRAKIEMHDQFHQSQPIVHFKTKEMKRAFAAHAVTSAPPHPQRVHWLAPRVSARLRVPALVPVVVAQAASIQ